MVVNNKVLTVSYGTFSCTLEGFDDSFGTMKAIAEYFRDLASDDRYFGAEPPQPDAEMLTRIAQREIDRQVEAHSTDSGAIILRATAAAAPIAATPIDVPAPAPEVTAEDVAEDVKVEPALEVADDPTPAPAPAPEAASPEAVALNDTQTQPTEVEVEDTDTAEATQVAEEVAQPVTDVPEPVEVAQDVVDAAEDDSHEDGAPKDAALTDVAEKDVTEDDPAVEPELSAQEDDAQDIPATDTAPDVTEVAEPADEVVQEIVVAQDVQPPETVPAADSIAAKLQRIRAVVSQSDPFTDTDDYSEDEDADGFVAAQAAGFGEVLKNRDDDLSESQDDPDHDAQIVAMVSQMDSAGTEADELAGDLTSDQADDQAGEEEEAAAADAGEDFFVSQDRGEEEELFEDPNPAGVMQTAEASEAEDQDKDPVQARVVKVKRADLEAAIASGQLEQIGDADEDTDKDDTEYTAEDNKAQSDTPQEASSLSPEDEADLMRELAEVEDELSTGSQASHTADNLFGQDMGSDADAQDERDETAHAVLTDAVGKDDADLSRLMDAADQKLEDPETSSSRDTYSQLRAAAAAAEAEKSAGGSIEDKGQDEAYRDDLACVVRPRRPAVEGDRPSRRTADNRPAPLKLVAEQRIDQGEGVSQRGPVRPRRVMTAPATPANSSDATGADKAFAEFAERVGATDLPELLEAAAAYLSFVEGQDNFSRPQLMNKVRLVKQDEFNREDGLRSFGQLLRDGKIKKCGGGRFAASGEIGFRPDEREAG